jgi:hypothetical protein
VTRPPHPESQADAPDTVRWDPNAGRHVYRPMPHEIPDGQRWNSDQWHGLGRMELLDGTPVPDMGLVTDALEGLRRGHRPEVNQVAALADRMAQLEGELAKVKNRSAALVGLALHGVDAR